ncbi:hypothetical protein, partial [Candidatus Methylomirabilis sp.]|uniref:hypothetical protein n=1 Tax=Candidatus Methylomirabilis sp. TaxID=2032687 RepID=UPI002A624E29|nr:hypothetical protein [Candidatus Methylomirabilis sp.]
AAVSSQQFAVRPEPKSKVVPLKAKAKSKTEVPKVVAAATGTDAAYGTPALNMVEGFEEF